MIRLATAMDAEKLASIWNPWILETSVTFNATPKSAQDLADMIANRPYAVFTTDDHAGFATYGQFRSGIGYATCMEHTIILSPTAQGRGLGRALMLAVESHAAARGAHQMIGGISAENDQGLRFHAALGYAEIARVSEAGFKFGRFIDLVLMRKFLS